MKAMRRLVPLSSLFALLAAGDRPPPEIEFDRALAALHAGQLATAERALDAIAAPADDTSREVSDAAAFLRGNVVFARALIADAAADLPDAPPAAFERALALVGSAVAAWKEAALRRSDWPAARRNVERALRLAADLEQRKAQQKEKKREEDPGGGAEPNPVALPPPDASPLPDELPLDPALAAATPEQLRELEAALARVQKEKIEQRRAESRRRAGDVECDW